MKVLKFGGTSVGSAENIYKVIDILKQQNNAGEDLVVVLSAMGGMTNKLEEIGRLAAAGNEHYLQIFKEFENFHFETIRILIDAKHQSSVFAVVKKYINDLEDVVHGVFLVRELSLKTNDFILSHGERLNNFIVSHAAAQKGLESEYIDSREIIKTNNEFGSAKINFKITNQLVVEKLKENNKIKFVTGFIGSNNRGETTTLGRGGSDFTASILAATLNAKEIEIWTDVDGVMTADPRKVKKAFSLPAISYNEAMELSHFGAKVIYPPTLQPAFTKNIPIRIKNTFNPKHAGTYISEKSGKPNKLRVKGISSINDVCLLNIQGSGLVGVTGISSRLFSSLAHHGINIILITQASSEHSICLAVSPDQAKSAKIVIEEEFFYEIQAKKISEVKIEEDLAVVAIIGENMRETPGISGKMFSALGKNGINIVAIAQGSSELNISSVIHKSDLAKALNALHDSLFLSETQTLNVFVVGPGLIGSTLLQQLHDQIPALEEEKGLKINVVGLANSKKMVFDAEGLAIEKWGDALEKSTEKADINEFVDKMQSMNLPNSVFVDNTSSELISSVYKDVLESSINIVTPNKIANSGSYAQYHELRSLAMKRGVKFYYETNVGAGLPVIGTLRDLIHSGDDILVVEGVLSGSLSYIFNTYDGSTSFKEIVLKAKESGFTEPDPRDDLSGKDVARKILILSREAGYSLEPDDVNIENILPEACLNAPDVDAFLDELEKADDVFKKIAEQAKSESKKIRFIASMVKGKISVGMKLVDSDHPFYSLSGSDNMIVYTTKRYEKNPLVIKGPGAGAEVTAAGVFADIIRVGDL